MSYGVLPQKIVLWLDSQRRRHAYTTVYGDESVQDAVNACIIRHQLSPARVTVALASEMPPEKL